MDFIIFISLIAAMVSLVILLLQKEKKRRLMLLQYDQLRERYREEVLSALTQREEWLYNMINIQSQLVFRVIRLLPVEERDEFLRRRAALAERIELTRENNNQLHIEQSILENDLITFGRELADALSSSRLL